MNTIHVNTSSWAILKTNTMDHLLNKAKEHEKKYNWYNAADFYEKALGLALEKRVPLEANKLRERMGFCFYKAALQAVTNEQFKKRMKLAIKSYREAAEIPEGIKEGEKDLRININRGLVAYAMSWLEIDPKKKKKLLDEWWTLENQVLKSYEAAGDLLSIGRTCNDLMEYSSYDRFWIPSDWQEIEKQIEEGFKLGEKAIKALSNIGDDYELARAYCFTSWYYSWPIFYGYSEDRITEFNQKATEYSRKALELSEKTGDAWLISWSNISAWNAAQFCNFNPASASKYSKITLKLGTISKDNVLIGFGRNLTSFSTYYWAQQEEDPDKQRDGAREALDWAQKSTKVFQVILQYPGLMLSYTYHTAALCFLASIETNFETKHNMLEKVIEVFREGIDLLGNWKRHYLPLFFPLSNSLCLLSETEKRKSKKSSLLHDAEHYSEKSISLLKKIHPFSLTLAQSYHQLALVQSELAKIETSNPKKIELLNKAVISMENCLELAEKKSTILPAGWARGYHLARHYYRFGAILEQLQYLMEEKKLLHRAIEAYKGAIENFAEAELTTHVAESYWQIAKLHDIISNHLEATSNYKSASENYEIAAEKIPSLRTFYRNYSSYMQAWSQIEQAKYSHSIEKYEEAQQHYEKAARLHQSTSSWNYLTPNYLAWSYMEEAESLSRRENTQKAKQTFQKAYEQFCKAEESFKQKLEEIMSADERQMAQRLFEASDLRRKYCRGRILMEEAKLLDRQGKYLQSSKSYEEAAQNISTIVDKTDNEAERKELKYIAILCQAWQKMANAEETASSESYLEAAALFEQAKEQCYTSKASLWALGNSNFCKGLAAGIRYQGSMDLKENALAKRYIKSAASSYLQAGFNNASEYAKATQRLFDAYVFMNQAESEVDPGKKSKQYQMAENLLQIAAGSFMKAKQPEKTSQVQQILKTVREEKTLAISLNEVMHAPSITSSTMSFTAPSPTNETSVGLESFQHANVQANLVTHVKEVKVGESFDLSIELVNAGKEPALLMRVEELIPRDFIVVKKPEIYRLEESTLNMKGKKIAPLKLVEAKLVLQPSKKGEYQLNPKIHYLDEVGIKKTVQLKTLEIEVEEVILSDRVSTGTKELDSLLLGGVPRGYAVVLAGPPGDEREMIIKNFLVAGAQEEVTFYITTEASGLEDLLDNPNFILFLCNPKPKSQVPDLPNIYKLRSKTDLTNLSISLAKAYRNLDQSKKKRICMEIVSDVLLDYGPRETRKWISELITDLGSKNFTILSAINPLMHASEELHAILDLFDGEIELTQTEDPLECKKTVQVKKLRNKHYVKNPICIHKYDT